jgi:hypothetical protein
MGEIIKRLDNLIDLAKTTGDTFRVNELTAIKLLVIKQIEVLWEEVLL